jgi:hypothetical protein
VFRLECKLLRCGKHGLMSTSPDLVRLLQTETSRVRNGKDLQLVGLKSMLTPVSLMTRISIQPAAASGAIKVFLWQHKINGNELKCRFMWHRKIKVLDFHYYEIKIIFCNSSYGGYCVSYYVTSSYLVMYCV